MDIKVFGEKEDGREYIWRPAVYGVIFNEEKNRIAVIQADGGKYFLPGGGIESNETHEQCLKREIVEEMGMEVEIGRYIGCAQRYFFSTKDFRHYLSEGHFYLGTLGKQIGKPIEEDHFLEWLEPNRAIECLFHEHQSWAVKEVLGSR